ELQAVEVEVSPAHNSQIVGPRLAPLRWVYCLQANSSARHHDLVRHVAMPLRVGHRKNLVAGRVALDSVAEGRDLAKEYHWTVSGYVQLRLDGCRNVGLISWVLHQRLLEQPQRKWKAAHSDQTHLLSGMSGFLGRLDVG